MKPETGKGYVITKRQASEKPEEMFLHRNMTYAALRHAGIVHKFLVSLVAYTLRCFINFNFSGRVKESGSQMISAHTKQIFTKKNEAIFRKHLI
ncbi:hypothetical protein [Allomesorhizobium camelthorni]|uniref:Uncharacterized protein n=1 Tax=Allomesorhizobium camelthorni TaxID=475069 RepID=A0A6G4W7P3_9HYPH|nr:hypothetical protein [Mesorhizobium camelthorni]NGO50348.1 hypothetical protein [Mesorhizobium camelthorni]